MAGTILKKQNKKNTSQLWKRLQRDSLLPERGAAREGKPRGALWGGELLLMETQGIGWAGDSISQHAPRWARPAATPGLAPALALRRCIGARGGSSHGGARGDGGGNE